MDKLSVAYQLREPKSKTETAIQCHITVNGQRIVFPTHWRVIPKNWSNNKADKNSGKFFKSSQFGYRERNQELMSMKLDIEDLFNRYLRDNGKAPSKVEFRNILDLEFNRVEKPRQMDLFEFIESFIETKRRRMQTAGKRTTGNTILSSYKQTRNLLQNFEQSTRNKVDFETISIELYYQLIEFMEAELDLKPNTIGTHIKNLKAFLNEALEQQLTTNRTHQSKHFIKPSEESYTIALTWDEVDEIISLDLSDRPYLDSNRDLFIVVCTTGLRYSDLRQLNKKRIIRKASGNEIQLKTQKTGQGVVIPIDSRLQSVIDKYQHTETGFPKVISNQKLNRTLKEIGKQIESLNEMEVYNTTKGGKQLEVKKKRYELIGTHTGRRTFATRWYLSELLPTRVIMAITGHKTERSFFRYIRLTPDDVTESFRRAIEEQLKSRKSTA